MGAGPGLFLYSNTWLLRRSLTTEAAAVVSLLRQGWRALCCLRFPAGCPDEPGALLRGPEPPLCPSSAVCCCCCCHSPTHHSHVALLPEPVARLTVAAAARRRLAHTALRRTVLPPAVP
ncbi:hypothetical protein P154DRAFT_523924 [Amniculicola lignicola CBS 123094]|uniref:Uncharacterized protein n=1 Tax=Amniculicola lignicola CBS 123094 TaxID=1392246 RepID=A0A6A5WCJ6_9PLEO|nr:hypothetical protein P154DRAFT_523924 [Amniculicola lignicola CBS 123094]